MKTSIYCAALLMFTAIGLTSCNRSGPAPQSTSADAGTAGTTEPAKILQPAGSADGVATHNYWNECCTILAEHGEKVGEIKSSGGGNEELSELLRNTAIRLSIPNTTNVDRAVVEHFAKSSKNYSAMHDWGNSVEAYAVDLKYTQDKFGIASSIVTGAMAALSADLSSIGEFNDNANKEFKALEKRRRKLVERNQEMGNISMEILQEHQQLSGRLTETYDKTFNQFYEF